ncbi:MAG: small basic protein [Planctomycetaceae bacterium]|nr:small basic protein [Planctomycetaceae bacterium]
MAMHNSLRRKSDMARRRSVLSREERIVQMKVDEKWTDTRSPFGLPKTRIAKQTVGKKKKKEKKEEEGDAAPAAKGAAGAKGAPAAKAAPAAKGKK